MRLHAYSFLWVVLITTDALSQGLTQSADGKSTIPIKGSAVGLDISKTEASFGYNNLDQSIKTKKVRGLYGVELKAKNEEGFGNLFSNGDLVPSGSLTGFAGITFSNAFNSTEVAEEAKRRQLNTALTNYRHDFRIKLQIDFTTHINSICIKFISDPIHRVQTITNLTNILAQLSDLNREIFYDKIKSLTDVDPDIEAAYLNLISYAKEEKEEFLRVGQDMQGDLENLHNLYTKSSYQRFTIFGFGGITAINFKHFIGIDSANLSKSFDNIDDRGGNFGLGINYQWRNLWFGLTYSYVSTNNFSVLKKKDYTLRTTSTVNSQALIEETKITGYSGKYGTLELNNLNFDLVIRLRLDKSFKSTLLINPYIRASIFSRDTNLLPGTTNVGSGFYFLKGKFLGGLYVELPDIDNNLEKAKPTDEQNLRPASKRLTFGIVTKISLASLFGW